ncbi:GntR family transcriptional regulator [Microbacterium sp. NPDC077644]|jgi:DNA-binding GntR family transcriptional regulator|uniref:GntR family transcriptional regulator n=1 Tax=Microbacterium sp. NPDC077644 TaxID=3155055 RepID=UPI003450E3B6
MSLPDVAYGISPPRKSDMVYRAIKQDLIRGKYKVGQDLVIVDLSGRLGTSRQPVLEALKRLDREGFVEVIPQIGVRTIRPTADGVRDFYRVFGNVEGLAAEIAAGRVLPDEMEQLRLRTAEMDERVSAGEVPMIDYLLLNRRVHSAIHTMTGSPEVIRAAEAYWDKSDFLIATIFGSSDDANSFRVSHDHDAILQAIERGDAPGARKLATEHILSVGRALADRLQHSSDSTAATPGVAI